ncbi:unnamed protein product [Staurois parvus]|uniref:Uncharacterized protein n=1 Tax=Staurois parvus TaxID=386267 RepID=A0ABN9GGL5_9NEOB|nr:unnamed protein product [Staurois parvus]
MTRDCRHSTGDDQRLRTVQEMTKTADIVQEMTRDCGQSTGDDQETADIVQEMTRDCRNSTGDDQRLRTQYRR